MSPLIDSLIRKRAETIIAHAREINDGQPWAFVLDLAATDLGVADDHDALDLAYRLTVPEEYLS